ncbi:glycosylase [Planctomycetales bacterium]|nr:glycosylase [Planctomycetales bacterium]
MKWEKQGLIFTNNGEFDLLKTHTQCPTPLVFTDKIRVYFSARLANQQSLPTFIDVDKENPAKVLYVNSQPILDFGRKGTFDENGITVGSILKKDNMVFLYYSGWSQCKTVPYENFIGLAISSDNGETFKKIHDGPVIPPNEFNPIGTTSPTALKYDNGFIAYYASTVKWVEIASRLENVYYLTYALSTDGTNWHPQGKVIIPPHDDLESSVRPAVLQIGGIYHMWFSYRGSFDFRNGGVGAYRMGYAYSKDLINWTRDDAKAGIDVSESGWDSAMICYPAIVKVGEKVLMFYNGNEFGKSGFGVAVLRQN